MRGLRLNKQIGITVTEWLNIGHQIYFRTSENWLGIDLGLFYNLANFRIANC